GDSRPRANARGYHYVDLIETHTTTSQPRKIDFRREAIDGDRRCRARCNRASRHLADGNHRGCLAEPIGINRYRFSRSSGIGSAYSSVVGVGDPASKDTWRERGNVDSARGTGLPIHDHLHRGGASGRQLGWNLDAKLDGRSVEQWHGNSVDLHLRPGQGRLQSVVTSESRIASWRKTGTFIVGQVGPEDGRDGTGARAPAEKVAPFTIPLAPIEGGA